MLWMATKDRGVNLVTGETCGKIAAVSAISDALVYPARCQISYQKFLRVSYIKTHLEVSGTL